MNKRAIAILGAIFILIVGTLGFIIYKRSQTSEPETTTPEVVEQPIVETPTDPVDEQPEEQSGRAVKLTDDMVVTPVLFFQGNGITYFNKQGQLFKTNLDVSENTVLLSNKQEVVVPAKASMSRIMWPLVGNSYIAEFGSGLTKSWSFYNPDIGAYVDLPAQVKSIDWMPSGNKVMFVWVDNGKATLNLANADTTAYQTLTDFYEPDNVISIAPDGQKVLFYRTQTSDMTKNTINSVTVDGKTFATVVKDGYNTGVQWSPDSKKFLFTRYDSSTQKYNLWYSDISSGEIRNLGVATSQTKAVWAKDSQSIMVAVPTSGIAGQGITQDTIYKIDVVSNSRQEFAPGITVDAQELFLNLDGTVLFFRNAQDNALYYMMLN